jgi:hypothetical protein
MTTMTKPIRSLTALDRCDRCQAQAWVAAKGVEGELFFCGHHFVKHEDKIVKWAYQVIDEREFINQKSESSA